jgi:hypothetical protein
LEELSRLTGLTYDAWATRLQSLHDHLHKQAVINLDDYDDEE